MPIYCDESGGIGRGVMTLAALSIEAEAAHAVLERFRQVTGLSSELKGSRIDLGERALLFELLDPVPFSATVGIAISALRPELGDDRGDHDIDTYARLLEDVIGSMLPQTVGCARVVIDDGRYGPETLELITKDIAAVIGPCGSARLELSHRLPGLQLADVIANSLFNRALVSERQSKMAAIVAPFLESGRIKLRVLASNP
ncbi:MAG: hypothetical protein WBO17_13875 [Sphingorhabdus sp.]